MTPLRPSYAPFAAIVDAHADARSRASSAIGLRLLRATGGRGGTQQRSHRGVLILKAKIAVCTAAVAFAVFATGTISAQPVPPGYYPAPDDSTGLPPQEVAAIVRSTGLEPL